MSLPRSGKLHGEASGAQADHNMIVKLLMLLGCRREEVGGIRFDGAVERRWSLPAERSKNKVGRKIILPAAALELLDGVHRNGRDRIFGQRAVRRWVLCDGLAKKKKLDVGCGVSGWHLHDLRRSMRSGLSRIGVLPHIAEEAIGHTTHKSGVIGTYDRHDYSGEVKTALAMWADHLLTVVNGGDRKVVPLRGA